MPLLLNHIYTGAVRINNTGSEMDYIVQYNSCSMTFFLFVSFMLKESFLLGRLL